MGDRSQNGDQREDGQGSGGGGETLRPVFIWTNKDPVAIDNPRLILDIVTGQPISRKSSNHLFHVNFEQCL